MPFCLVFTHVLYMFDCFSTLEHRMMCIYWCDGILRQTNQSQKCCCVVRANHKLLNSGGSMLHVLALWSLDTWTWKKISKLPCFTPEPVFRGETQSWISSRAVCVWLQNLRTDIRSCPLNGCSQTSRHLNRTKLKSDKNISCRHYVVN